jgi:hypothetical protein
MGAVQFDAIYSVPFDDTSACFGSMIQLDAGKGFDTYHWLNTDSTGQTFTLVPELFVPGNREFVVEANFRGNDYRDTIRVWLSLPSVDLGPDISNCADDTAYLDAGPDFVGYDWPGTSQDGQQFFKTWVDVYTDSEYAVTVSDIYGCEATDTVKVHYKKLPASVYINQPQGPPDHLEAQTSSDVTELQWYRDGNPIQGATSNVYTATEDGYYLVEGTTAEGCSLKSDSVLVLVSGINDFTDQEPFLFEIYPNPARTIVFLKICTPFNKGGLTLIDASGRIFMNRRFELHNLGDEIELDISGLPPGIYNIRLQTGNESFNQKLMVEKGNSRE